jgi:hypothetical protein
MDKKKDLDLDGIEFEELEDGYDSIPKESWKDKSFVLETVKEDGIALEYADKSLKKDKSIVLEAVKQYGFALEYADESLQKDPDIIKAAKR